MALRVYTYKHCGTCRRALVFLEEHGVAYKNIPIREAPPSKSELKKMLGHMGGTMKRLFNVSGADYRALKLKDTLSEMSNEEALALLASNGNLVKRPFAIASSEGITGFNEGRWQEIFLGSP